MRRGDRLSRQANVVRGEAKGTVSAYAWARLGDITSAQFRALASIQRDFIAPGTVLSVNGARATVAALPFVRP